MPFWIRTCGWVAAQNENSNLKSKAAVRSASILETAETVGKQRLTQNRAPANILTPFSTNQAIHRQSQTSPGTGVAVVAEFVSRNSELSISHHWVVDHLPARESLPSTP